MGRIVTYAEGRYAQIQFDSGERILFSMAQSGITIYRLRLAGLIPGEQIAEWLPQDLEHFVELLGGEHPTGTPFRYTVEFLTSMKSISDLQAYLMWRPL